MRRAAQARALPGLARAAQSRRGVATVESSQYFKKVLVANRGEIACRVFETCKKLGIGTVAVFSTPDQHTKFRRVADESVHIGPAASKDSYLRIDRVIEACKATGADAVHPGYGFLSENAAFCEALEKEGITFIGPSVHAIQSMGDKIESKILAGKAGVNIIPGHEGEIKTVDDMLAAAESMGYPIMIKASAGGGGKGLRIARNEKQAREEWVAAKGEALASFGDDRMLVEKFIDDPRHIEIQIIADKCGNTVYLPERECSIQRRNQKVIEEAPSSFIDPETRKAMGEQAAALSRVVGYHTAGTVEMLIDSSRNFYFLEMNTRLQVEHPVTEEITNLDLVHEMLRAARGLPLTVTQDEVKIDGHATECRVYAEDPTRNYAPSIGRMTRYVEPEGPGVRVDSGITEGSEISVYYDPMIAKLITKGKTREESINRAKDALDRYVIRGVKHNVCLMRDVLSQQRYVDGDITTNYLPETYPEGFAGHELTPDERLQVVSVASAMRLIRSRWYGSGGDAGAPLAEASTYHCVLGDSTVEVSVAHVDNGFVCTAGGQEIVLSDIDWKVGDPRWVSQVAMGNEAAVEEAFQLISTNEIEWEVQYRGSPYKVKVYNALQAGAAKHMPPKKVVDTSKFILAPMPGAVVDVKVKVGDKVPAGGVVCVLEAMKMQQSLTSLVDGVVKAVHIEPGAIVDENQNLISFE